MKANLIFLIMLSIASIYGSNLFPFYHISDQPVIRVGDPNFFQALHSGPHKNLMLILYDRSNPGFADIWQEFVLASNMSAASSVDVTFGEVNCVEEIALCSKLMKHDRPSDNELDYSKLLPSIFLYQGDDEVQILEYTGLRKHEEILRWLKKIVDQHTVVFESPVSFQNYSCSLLTMNSFEVGSFAFREFSNKIEYVYTDWGNIFEIMVTGRGLHCLNGFRELVSGDTFEDVRDSLERVIEKSKLVPNVDRNFVIENSKYLGKTGGHAYLIFFKSKASFKKPDEVKAFENFAGAARDRFNITPIYANVAFDIYGSEVGRWFGILESDTMEEAEKKNSYIGIYFYSPEQKRYKKFRGETNNMDAKFIEKFVDDWKRNNLQEFYMDNAPEAPSAFTKPSFLKVFSRKELLESPKMSFLVLGIGKESYQHDQRMISIFKILAEKLKNAQSIVTIGITDIHDADLTQLEFSPHIIYYSSHTKRFEYNFNEDLYSFITIKKYLLKRLPELVEYF